MAIVNINQNQRVTYKFFRYNSCRGTIYHKNNRALDADPRPQAIN